MRIAQVLTQVEAGGAQQIAYRLNEGLRGRGWKAELVFLYRKRDVGSMFGAYRALLDHRPAGLIDGVRLFRRLLSTIREVEPDAVITHTAYANVLGQAIAAICGVPVRVAVHHSSRRPAKLVDALDSILGWMGVYTRIVVVSHAARKQYDAKPNRYKSRVRVIRNGLHVGGRSDEPLPPHIAKLLSRLRESGKLVVNVGRLSAPKNQAVLIRSLEVLPEHQLVLVGEGELRGELEGLAQAIGVRERVHFLGELPHDQVQAVVRAASVFAFPSRYEGLPVALLEAAHNGVPIVATDIPEIREVVGDGALLVPVDEVLELARAIERVTASPDICQELVRRAREQTKGLTEEAMVNDYASILTDAGSVSSMPLVGND